jgi:uncharacterized protein (TIGR03435 family)
MLGFFDTFENRREAVQSRIRCVGVIVLLVLSVIVATSGRAQSQLQSTTLALPDYKYDVASIKPSKLTNTRWGVSADGFTVTAVTLKGLVQFAFRVTGDYGLSGGPAWLNSQRYDVEAKMDPDAADALNKLSNDDRLVVQQHMLQALLAERFGLVFHRETREMQVYTLVIAKNGSKLHEAKPGDTYPNGIKLPNGAAGTDVMIMRGGPGGSFTITAQAVPLSHVLPQLALNAGRPTLDKTGLTGKYDFTLTYSLDQNASAGAPKGQPALAPADPSAPSIFTAIQEQLGLKLEAGKGPVEVIVIDHVEKPSGN